MKLIKNIALTLAALTLAACTQGEPEIPANGGGNNNNDELVEIRPTLSIAGLNEAVSTRGVEVDGTEEMRISYTASNIYRGFTNGTRAAGTGAQTITLDRPEYYPTDGSEIDIHLFYPADNLHATTTREWRVFWQTPSTTKPNTVDILHATAKGSKTNPVTTLEFKHIHTQIQFCPYAETQAVADQWGNIKNIRLTNIANKIGGEVAFNLEKGIYYINFDGRPADCGIFGFQEGHATGFPPSICTYAERKTKAAILGDPLIIPPTPIIYTPNNTLKIDIFTVKDGVVKTTTLTPTVTELLANTPYRFYLRFTGQSIEVDVQPLSIENWVPGADQSGTLNKTYPYVENGNIIVASEIPVVNGSVSKGTHGPYLDNDLPVSTDYHDWNLCSRKFEVAKANATNTWNDEMTNHTKCPAPWRMPNLYEAWMIRTMRHQLTGVDFLNTTILTATRLDNNTAAWYLNMDDSYNLNHDKCRIDKNTPTNIRCIRDIVPPNPGSDYPYVVAGKYIVFKDAAGDAQEPYHPKWEQTPAYVYFDYNYNPDIEAVSAMIRVAQSDVGPTVWGSTNGGCTAPWRRPTNLELQYIYWNKDKLTGVDTFSSSFYWSPCELDKIGGEYAYVANFAVEQFSTSKLLKTNATPAVRCVKDIE